MAKAPYCSACGDYHSSRYLCTGGVVPGDKLTTKKHQSAPAEPLEPSSKPQPS